MRIEINNVEIPKIRTESFEIQDSINERSICRFEISDYSLNLHPIPSQPIEVYDENDELLWAGLTERPREWYTPGSPYLRIPLEGVDNQALADFRIVAESYENKTVGFIVRDLLAKYLAAEGVTEGIIEEGPIVTSAVFPYIYVSDAFAELSELSGFFWQITADRKLNFMNRQSAYADFNIEDNSKITAVEVQRNQDKYRNRQYIRAGQDTTDPQTESFAGDGETRTFTVGYKIAKVPAVKVNGSIKTVGIRGVETGKDFYWSKNEKEITQDQEGTPLKKDLDILEVTYVGFFPIIVVSEDSTAIQSRKESTGGSGIYEAVDSNTNLNSSQAALEFAQGKLRRFAQINNMLSYRTEIPGLKAGQIQKVTLSHHGIEDGEFLITSVTTRYIGNKITYDLKLADGEAVDGWANFFKELQQSGQTFVIRENEVLVRLVTQSEKVGWKEVQIQKVNACPIPSENLHPSSTIYPC